MKVETRVLDYASNVDASAERVGMSIDESALSHIMSVLTDLYSDPEMAVIREYSTNALDAHVDAGETRPIEVTLPSALSPFFSVRDYGAGLDAGDIREIYSRYGTSTKRDSNDVVGMLGLGCKSALTYSDQFTLTSTKDGRTVQVLVSRDEDGAGSMTVVDDSPADGRERGTEVTVPAKRINAFPAKAAGFFRFWTPGTVLVNGEVPPRVEGLWISDSLLITDTVETDTVVMGNVPYPFLDGIAGASASPAYLRRTEPKLVAFVDIGAVSFTPSRESLQDTKRTRAALEAVKLESLRLRDEAIRAQVAAADSPSDAVRLYAEGRRAGYGGEPPKYQGRSVPEKLVRAQGSQSLDGLDVASLNRLTFLVFGESGYRRRKNGERYLAIKPDGDERLFDGFEARELSPTKRDKLAVWLEAKGLEAAPTILVGSFTKDERFWLDGREVHDWREVEAVKLSKAAPRATRDGKPRGAYDGLVPGHRPDSRSYVSVDHFQAGEINTSKPIFYFHGSKLTLPHVAEIRAGVLPEDATIVALPGGRVAKFRRDFPAAITTEQAARKAAERWIKKQTQEDLNAYDFQRSNPAASKLKGLDSSRVEGDATLAKAIDLANRSTDQVRDGLARFSKWITREPFSYGADILREYPLLENCYAGLSLYAEDVYLYIAAVRNRASAANEGSKNVSA